MSEQPLDESNINSGLILLRFCYAIRWHRQNQRPALFALRPNSADSSILGGTEQNRNGRPEPHYERVALSAELALPSDPSGGFFRSFSYLDPRAECQQRGQWIKTSAGHFASTQPAMLNRIGLPIGPARRTGTRAATFRDLYEA